MLTGTFARRVASSTSTRIFLAQSWARPLLQWCKSTQAFPAPSCGSTSSTPRISVRRRKLATSSHAPAKCLPVLTSFTLPQGTNPAPRRPRAAAEKPAHTQPGATPKEFRGGGLRCTLLHPPLSVPKPRALRASSVVMPCMQSSQAESEPLPSVIVTRHATHTPARLQPEPTCSPDTDIMSESILPPAEPGLKPFLAW